MNYDLITMDKDGIHLVSHGAAAHTFKPRFTLPSNVYIKRLKHKKLIPSGTSNVSLFTPDPADDAACNYINNPLPGAKNCVVFGILIRIKWGDESFDDAVNILRDSVILFKQDTDRHTEIIQPMSGRNFYFGARQVCCLITAMPRSNLLDPIFFIDVNQRFGFDIHFKDAAAFGDYIIEAEMCVALFTHKEMRSHVDKFPDFKVEGV